MSLFVKPVKKVYNMSMYLIIKSDSLESAKNRLKDLMVNNGYPLASYEYTIGERNIGYADGTIIKNNIVLSDWGNGNFCFEFDKHIVAVYGDSIVALSEQNPDTHWCTAAETRNYMPEFVL